jgi:hypothetical protein
MKVSSTPAKAGISVIRNCRFAAPDAIPPPEGPKHASDDGTGRGQSVPAAWRWGGDGDAAAKHLGRADQCEQQADDQLQQTPLVEIALGEVGPTARLDIRDTLTTPDAAALDASEHRIDLLTRIGTNCAALVLDAANSIEAGNSGRRQGLLRVRRLREGATAQLGGRG